MCPDRAGCEFLLSAEKSKKRAPQAACARIVDTAWRYRPLLRMREVATGTGPKGKGKSPTTLVPYPSDPAIVVTVPLARIIHEGP